MKGHIRERSPGHWAIVIDVRDPATGKRKRRWHSFAGTKRQAQVECARLISEAQSGVAVDPSRATLEAYLDRFQSDWVAVHVSARTGERYRQLLDHVRRHLGNRQIQKLRPADLAALYATLSRSGMAPRTINHVHSVVFQALKQAKAWGIIRDNVAETVKPPPVPEQELPILQPDRACELLEALRGHPFYLIAALALATGMRRNEILALRWQEWTLILDVCGWSCRSKKPRLMASGSRRRRHATGAGRSRCRRTSSRSCEHTGGSSRNTDSRSAWARRHRIAPYWLRSMGAGRALTPSPRAGPAPWPQSACRA